MWFWGLAAPKTYSQQAGHPGESMVQLGLKVWEEPMFQFEAEGKKKTKKPNNNKTNQCPSSKASQADRIPFYSREGQPSCLI